MIKLDPAALAAAAKMHDHWTCSPDTIGSMNAVRNAEEIIRAYLHTAAHPADGWRDIESAPSGWGNFFFVRPRGPNWYSGKIALPTVVQQIDGEFYTSDNELDPVYFGQNEPEDSPHRRTLEWHPIPQRWMSPTTAEAE